MQMILPCASAYWQIVYKFARTVRHCFLYSEAGTASARPVAE
jgi:hypothetical protein